MAAIKVPPFMQLKAIGELDFDKLTAAQKDQAKAILENIKDKIDGRARTRLGDNIMVENDICFIDTTSDYDDDAPAYEDHAAYNKFAFMFSSQDKDDISACKRATVMSDDYPEHNIDDAITKGENNLAILTRMLAHVKQAKKMGATKIAAVDFADWERPDDD